MNKVVSLIIAMMLSGCASVQMHFAKEEPVKLVPRVTLQDKLPDIDGPTIPIAVYGFQDKTGQKKPNDKLALFLSLIHI